MVTRLTSMTFKIRLILTKILLILPSYPQTLLLKLFKNKLQTLNVHPKQVSSSQVIKQRRRNSSQLGLT